MNPPQCKVIYDIRRLRDDMKIFVFFKLQMRILKKKKKKKGLVEVIKRGHRPTGYEDLGWSLLSL